MKSCFLCIVITLLYIGIDAWSFPSMTRPPKTNHLHNLHDDSIHSSNGSNSQSGVSFSGETNVYISTRRSYISHVLAWTFGSCVSSFLPTRSWSDAVQLLPNTQTIVRGTITIPSDIVLPPPEESPNAALYITARPNTPNNVPRAILDGSNGKPPPVLAARIPFSEITTFPYNFALEAPRDLTLEGATQVVTTNNNQGSASSSSTTTGGALTPPPSSYWFEGLDLIVSARWDTDGQAATRSPTDLVGRNVYYTLANQKTTLDEGVASFTLALTGRGWTGKLVTGGK